MATATYTEQDIETLALTLLQALYPGKSVRPRSFLRQMARALAQLLAQIQAAIADADRDGIPASEVVDGVLRSRASTTRLDEWAIVFGLPSNRGAAVFGRNGPQAATGGAGPVTGTAGTVVATGALLVDLSGQVQVELVSGVTVPVGNSIGGAFQATSAGAQGNLAVGTVLRWLSPPAGLASTVTLSTALQGGYDVESDLQLLDRLLRHLRAPPHGGTAADWRTWAETAQDATGRSLGIARAYVYPSHNGLGSVDVVITQGGSGLGRDPGSTKRAAVAAWLETQRVAGDAGVRVVVPNLLTASLDIKAAVQPVPSQDFDWRLNGASFVVGSATTTTITVVTASIPASLASMVEAGRKPRLQLLFPTTSPLPEQRRIVTAQISGSNTIYTLESAWPAAPSVGQAIYPGGGAVLPVALALVGYVDSVGPSNQSGCADRVLDIWEERVSLSNLADACVEAKSAEGAKVLVNVPGVGEGTGIQVSIGGPYTADDVLLYDNDLTLGPEMPVTHSVLILEPT